MADARIDQLADAAKAVIEAAANDPTGVLVACADVPEIDVNGEGADGFPPPSTVSPPQPRRVFVMAPQYADAGNATRGERATAYTLDVLTVEVCPEVPVPLAWRRERSAWVHDKIVTPLTNESEPLDGTAVPDTFEVSTQFHELDERHLFFCLVTVTYLEHAED